MWRQAQLCASALTWEQIVFVRLRKSSLGETTRLARKSFASSGSCVQHPVAEDIRIVRQSGAVSLACLGTCCSHLSAYLLNFSENAQQIASQDLSNVLIFLPPIYRTPRIFRHIAGEFHSIRKSSPTPSQAS